jgi:filamentous hemagglutinin
MESQQVSLPDGSVESGALAGTLQGGGTATTVDSYNRQLHQTEAQKLELLKAGKSATEKHRLDAAACALAKCSDGVPTNDAQYAKLQALQNKGKAYAAELQLLKNTGEFLYSPLRDKYGDWITSQNEALRRIGGGINLLAGSAGMFGGALVVVVVQFHARYSWVLGAVLRYSASVSLDCLPNRRLTAVPRWWDLMLRLKALG